MINIRKLVFILSTAMIMVLAAAETSLVRIDNAHEDPVTLTKQGLIVVRELDHCALALTNNDRLSELSPYKVQVLDRDPAQHEIYVVYDFAHAVDLTHYGDVLTTDGPAHILRLFPGMLEDLTRQRVELARLSLKPIAMPDKYSLPSVCVDPIVQQIVADVSADTILGFAQRLQRFRTRYSTHDSCVAAANWVATKFTAYGCDTVYFEYHTGGHAPNVIGIKRGVVYPDSIYAVIDGHLDATSNQAPNIAPGADDNGSGTVAAIEAARVMRDYLFEYTAVYIAFTGEEFGLYGSEYYAAQADARNDVILGVLNGDMIAYSDYLPESLEVLHNSANLSFANFFIACADTYTTLLTDRHQVSSVPSDIQPFYDHGYPGICTIEDYWPTNPHYHMTSDTIGAGYNNNAFCTEGIKAEIAALSILIKPYGSGTMPAIPTIVKPLDFARLPTVLPTLSFTSTDPNGDAIQYRVMWDTDPAFASPDSSTTATYPSGTTVDFVFPASLPDGSTCWWKVKCTDPSGSGFWTNYTAARSFTIGTSLPESTCSWYQTTGAQFGFNAFNGTQVQGDSVLLLSVGYVLDTLLEQNFEASSSMPSGWTVVNGNGDAYQWTVGTTGDLGSYTPPSYGVRYVYYSDDDAGSGVINNNEELLSPKVYVPATATNLSLAYGYGFQVYQTGEKFRLKFRKKTGAGAWTAWADQVVYTTSGSGTQTVNLTSQLPCDSVQFDWFFSDSTASSHWGYASGADNVLLTYDYTFQNDYGTLTGSLVDYKELSRTYARTKWGWMVWRKAAGGDSIGLQAEYYNGSTWGLVPNGVLPGNAAGFFTQAATDSIDLSGLDTNTYRNLRLKSSFYRKPKSGSPGDAPNNPALLDWEVGNLHRLIAVAEQTAGGALVFGLSLMPNPFRGNLVIKFQVPNSKNQTNPKHQTSLRIFDAAGRLVRDLSKAVNHQLQSNTITWFGNDDLGRSVPAGVYFMRLAVGPVGEADGQEKIEKAILLR